MIHTIAAITNILTIIGIIILIYLLYKKVKIESGQWTAWMIIVVLFIGQCSSDKSDRSSKEKFIQFSADCEKCVLKPNRYIKIKEKIGLFQSVNYLFELHVPDDSSDIKVISKTIHFTGLNTGSRIDGRDYHFKLNDNGKIGYYISVNITSPFFLIPTYSSSYDIEGEIDQNDGLYF